MTQEQKEYLASLEEIEVLCVDYDAPYVYRKNGEPAGMLVSMLNDFAEDAGVSMKYTFCQNRDEAEQKLKEKKYDLMLDFPFLPNIVLRLALSEANLL